MGLFDKLFKPKAPSQDQFAKLVMDGIRQAGENRTLAYDQQAFRVSVERHSLFLNNLYDEYCAAPKANRSHVLKKLVRSWFGIERPAPEDFNDLKPDLLPVVRARSYIELTQLRMRMGGDVEGSWAYRPLGEDLGVALVYDLPESMRSIRQDELDLWGVTLYDALEIARDNLAQLPFNFMSFSEAKGIYISATNDNYDASRLILLDLIRQFEVKGDYIAMVPNRDDLIITGSDDVKMLEMMLTVAKDALQKPRPISGCAIRLDGDEWVPWLPEPSHPLYGEFRTLQMQSSNQDYDEQKALLEEMHEKTGEDIHVATHNVVRDEKTGRVFSYTMWMDGILSLLPQADVVAFMRNPDDQPRMIAWDQVVRVAGDLMEPLDIYPQRFRVSQSPTDDQLKAMGEPL